LIPVLCIVYGLTAAAGLWIAIVGVIRTPAPLPAIDDPDERSAVLEQARLVAEAAERQQPEHVILTMFYKGWLMESELESLVDYTEPRYEGDSFERRVASFGDTARRIDEIYRDATIALALLSTGGLILSFVMLLAPGYLRSLLLAVYPLVAVLTFVVLGINYDPLEFCWIPFIILGASIFVLQLVFSFRFGRPEHRTVDGLPGLMIYRRGLALVNLGAFMVVSALLMASGSIKGTSRSARAMLGQMVFGEDGIVLIGIVVGLGMLVPGVYYLLRKPTDDVV
jgi:hypothetical protein